MCRRSSVAEQKLPCKACLVLGGRTFLSSSSITSFNRLTNKPALPSTLFNTCCPIFMQTARRLLVNLVVLSFKTRLPITPGSAIQKIGRRLPTLHEIGSPANQHLRMRLRINWPSYLAIKLYIFVPTSLLVFPDHFYTKSNLHILFQQTIYFLSSIIKL